MDSGNVPIGFGLALAMNEPAMEAYANMTEEQKQSILVRAHQARSKKEMQALVASMAELDLMSEMLRRERRMLAGGKTASMEQMQTMAENILHED